MAGRWLDSIILTKCSIIYDTDHFIWKENSFMKLLHMYKYNNNNNNDNLYF